MLRPFPSSMRAAAITPADPVGACVARFPTGASLPRFCGGSASALHVSRPARRSLVLRPAWSLNRPWRPVASECFRRCRYLHHPLRLLPAGTDSCRAGFAPAEEWRLSTAHTENRVKPGYSSCRRSRRGRNWPCATVSGSTKACRPWKLRCLQINSTMDGPQNLRHPAYQVGIRNSCVLQLEQE